MHYICGWSGGITGCAEKRFRSAEKIPDQIRAASCLVRPVVRAEDSVDSRLKCQPGQWWQFLGMLAPTLLYGRIPTCNQVPIDAGVLGRGSRGSPDERLVF